MPDTSRAVYSLLSDKDEMPSSEQSLHNRMSPRSSRVCSSTAISWITALNIVFLTAGILFFLVAARIQHNIDAELISRVTSFSPASGAISYYPKLFNLSSEEAMHYQGFPTPEITAAWESITDDVRPTRISLDMLELVNTKDDETLVKYAEEDGGGVMASVGVLHQLHCVNLLRKATYLEYYKDDRLINVPPEELRGHLDHCIELLRQTIACAGDVTILTYRWHPVTNRPHPNFDKIHQCRRFDDILEWAIENAVHIPASHFARNVTATISP